MFRSLLVALDGTPFGEHALPLAVAVARGSGAVLELAHVHVPTLDIGDANPWAGGNDSDRGDEKGYLDGITRRVKEHAPAVVVRSSLLEGADVDSVAEALARHAEETGAGLVVLNSHARGGLARWWLGNVAEELVCHTAVPVLATPALDADPAWEPPPRIAHVLIAVDGSPLSEQVLPAALALGGYLGAEFTLLRVVEPAPVPAVDPLMAPAAVPDPGLVERLRADAETYLARLAARLRGDDSRMRLSTRVILDTDPADAICDFLRRHVGGESPVGLVALATHGREGLARLLLGSVSDRVLRHSPVPLLLQGPGKG